MAITANPDSVGLISGLRIDKQTCTRPSAKSESCTVTDFRSSKPNASQAPIRSSSHR